MIDGDGRGRAGAGGLDAAMQARDHRLHRPGIPGVEPLSVPSRQSPHSCSPATPAFTRPPPTVSILVDLDPASVDQTVIVESITADARGLLYLPDRVTGNILRVDPRAPKPVVLGRIEAREIKGKRVEPGGGAAQAAAQIERFTRTLPDGVTQQAIVANGLEFDAAGVLQLPIPRTAPTARPSTATATCGSPPTSSTPWRPLRPTARYAPPRATMVAARSSSRPRWCSPAASAMSPASTRRGA